jgi:hypothetical protein
LSRNKGRVGTSKGDSNPIPQHAIENNESGAALSFVVPTEFVDLPSEGRFYPVGHPLHGKDCIELKQMTAREEDILTSRTLLKKGVALDRVIESIIVDKSIDPDSLLIGDRNAIIIATRVSGYGSEYATKVGCPSCGETTKYTFDLNEASIYAGEDAQNLEIVDHEDGTFTTKLPRTHLDVRFRLLCGRDEKGLVKAAASSRKRKNAVERNVTSQLANLIVSVNEDSSGEAINYLIGNIPSIDSRHLRMAYKLAAPNVDLTQHFECGECGHDQEMEVPLGAEFFWPDS